MNGSARYGISLVLLCFAFLSAAALAQSALVVESKLNGDDKGTVLLVEREGQLFLGEAEAREWRLRMPTESDLVYQSQRFFLLSRLGVDLLAFDRRALRVELRAPASSFIASNLDAAGLEYPVTPAATGLFFNYDLLGTRVGGRAAADGAFELGAFTSIGVLTHRFVSRNLWSDDSSAHGYERIETTFRRDWADAATTLEIGDSTSRPGAAGRALRFGGVAFRSNFGLRPGFVPQPLPSFIGSATVPSTVEVFVRNQLRSTTEVPAGPFTLNNVPIVLGAGDARMVIRDALGREQIISSSFYAASGLLRKGLNDFAFAAGRLRANSLASSQQYGNNYASGLWRHGLSQEVTVEGRFETEEGVARVLGAAVDVGGQWGEAEAALAVDTLGGSRGLAALGYRYEVFDNSVGIRWEQAQSGFKFAGDTDIAPTPQRLVTLTASRRLSSRWNAGAVLIDERQHSGIRTRSANLSAFVAIASGTSAYIVLNRIETAGRVTSNAGIFFSYALGPRSSASASIEGGGDPRRTVGLQQALPIDEGWGYRLSATDEPRGGRLEIAAGAQTRIMTLTSEWTRDSTGAAGLRLGASGSLAVIGSTPFAARLINDSFALVQLDDFADMPILLNNHIAGRTDRNGQLILPRLNAYQPNEIRVEADDLPADARIGKDRDIVVAPFRSGVTVELDVKRVSGAIVRLRTSQGSPVPAGAAVRIEPDAQATSVAQRGEFFISGRPGRKRVLVELRGQSCSIEFDLPAGRGGAFQTLGPFECVGIQP